MQATFWYWQDCCEVQIRETSGNGGWRIQDLQWPRDPLSFQIQCTLSVDFVGGTVEEIAVPLAGHSYHHIWLHCFHCKDFISHQLIILDINLGLSSSMSKTAGAWGHWICPMMVCNYSSFSILWNCGKDLWLCKLCGRSNCLHLWSIYFQSWRRWTFN
jgi:hypothetical protein